MILASDLPRGGSMASTHQPNLVIAGVMGFTGFSVACVAGLAAGNEPTAVLLRAIVAMGLCYAAGRVIGWASVRTAAEYIEDYRKSRPVPELSVAAGVPAVVDGRSGA